MTYSRVANHGAMAFDAHRNSLYEQALRRLVEPESVVLDLGAGVGLHALLAAAAGAARVYLVEPEPVVNIALEVARSHGISDRVTVLQDRIENLELPEQVDLIVSVLTGNLLFSEDLMPTLFHARDRYLRPGGSMLPDRAQLLLAPVQAQQLHDKHVARWSMPVMGLDYSAARRFAANEIIWLRRDECSGIERLGTEALVADLDLATSNQTDCDGRGEFTNVTSGLCHGLLGWIRIKLADTWLSTDPASPEVHWSPAMLPLDPPLMVTKGERIEFALSRPTHGDWTWTLAGTHGTRRHSTFLAKADGTRELSMLSPSARPGLGTHGARARFILQRLGEGASNAAIAQELTASLKLDPADALRETQALARRYGKLA